MRLEQTNRLFHQTGRGADEYGEAREILKQERAELADADFARIAYDRKGRKVRSFPIVPESLAGSYARAKQLGDDALADRIRLGRVRRGYRPRRVPVRFAPG